MVLRLIASDFLFAAIFVLASCTDFERNNPDDTGSINYDGLSSSSTEPSSSSVTVIYGDSVTYGNETYPTVVIGEQTWMARNLNYDVPNKDTDVCYDNDPANCAKYGRLYDWATAKTACPSGWHLPSDDDWSALMTAVGGDSTAITKLKAREGWSYGNNGTNEFGFSALPGGFGTSDGNFSVVGYYGYLLSASGYDSYNVLIRRMGYDGKYVEKVPGGKSNLFSVRCLKDSGTSPSSSSSNTTNQSECNAFCFWEESGCVPISPDPTGEYGTVIRTCEEALSNCLKYSPSKQLHSTDKCNGGYINPNNIKKDTLTDNRDGNSYEYVKIGTQTWMAENLNYNASGSKCYDNKEANCAIYGRLYNWETANTACPEGWHLPSDDEWDVLVKLAGGSLTLKTTSGWSNTESGGNGSDKYGFSALPGGSGSSGGSFSGVGNSGYWWTATGNDYTAYVRSTYSWSVVSNTYGTYGKSDYFSVRCVQN